MKMKKFVTGALASASIVVCVGAASASTLLTDGDFSGTIDVRSHSGDPLGTAGGTVCGGSCGNPGSALQASGNYSGSAAGASNSVVGFIDHSLSYNPGASGAIATIDASYDRLLRANFAFSVPFNFRLVIEQGGVDYATAIAVGGPDTGAVWHNLSASGLTASNFSSIDFSTGVTGSAHPNFAGGPMLFGIEAAFTLSGGQVEDAFFDNFSISVNQTPLPAALPLFGSGLAALGFVGWRRKKRTAA